MLYLSTATRVSPRQYPTIHQTLHECATTLDLQLTERIETAQLEQRLNARAVFVLPYVILIIMCARGTQFRDFYQSGLGLLVVAIGAGMPVGMLLITRCCCR